MALCTIDPKTQTRTSAVMVRSKPIANSFLPLLTISGTRKAHFKPNAGRTNLKVLCGALVHKIISKLAEGSNESFKAESVEFEFNGSIHSVIVGKEVILCAGSLPSISLNL